LHLGIRKQIKSQLLWGAAVPRPKEVGILLNIKPLSASSKELVSYPRVRRIHLCLNHSTQSVDCLLKNDLDFSHGKFTLILDL
jgi:hypothetical protein